VATSNKDLSFEEIIDSKSQEDFRIKTHAEGPKGKIPFTEDILINEPSGNHFGLSQNAGMGWNPSELLRKQFLILSTSGGLKDKNGEPVALGFHTGHWELSSLVEKTANVINSLGGLPFSAYCSDPCDGRSMGTPGMFDSLPYRNDAAKVFRRIARSLPTAKGIVGIASCDKGLPAMMMALAGMKKVPSVIVPGGSTLAPFNGEDAGKIQSIGARFSQGEISLEYAQDMGCKACASPGGGCQFLGTAGTSQVIAESLGFSLTHSACTPSGTPAWYFNAERSAKALLNLEKNNITIDKILTDKAFENAMIVHAACGGSTNLLLHLPAIAHSIGRKRMGVEDWARINSFVPRLVDVLPNGPVGHPTSQFYAAGGVPEVMLNLKKLGLLNLDELTVSGKTMRENLEWWEESERRKYVREFLSDNDKINPENVILSKSNATLKGLTSTVTFPVGNIAPEGSVIKSTAIDPEVIDKDGVYRNTGKARVFNSEKEAMQSIKSTGTDKLKKGEILVVMCGGPSGTGMEETYQITAALRHLSYGKYIALLTDARFSGVSTGACIGHIGPEALAGGPIGLLKDSDLIEIIIDTKKLSGSINLVGENQNNYGKEWGDKEFLTRNASLEIKPNENLPDDTRLWAALQDVSGGTWGGCVYDVDKIVETLNAGKEALKKK
jgi:putative YjhG/YagF family dehydratase